MNASKEEALKWIAGLAPGDEVILKGGWKNNPVGVLRVTKVTPTGIIRTEEKLSFQQVKWTSRFWVKGIADTQGEIVPYDDTLASEAREYQARIAAENMKKAKLNKAKTLCYELAYGKRQMTLALAETIIAACEKTEGGQEQLEYHISNHDGSINSVVKAGRHIARNIAECLTAYHHVPVEEAINAGSWCELACVGEVYEGETFRIEVID